MTPDTAEIDHDALDGSPPISRTTETSDASWSILVNEDDLSGIIEDLTDADDRDARLAALAEFLDSCVPFGAVLPPPLGALVEAVDRPIFTAVMRFARNLTRKSTRLERIARRGARKAAREARRGSR